VTRNWYGAGVIGLVVTGLLLAGCGANSEVTLVQPKAVNVNAVATQYMAVQQSFEHQSTVIRALLASARTSDQVRAAYAAAAAAEHDFDGKLLKLPLFPTVIKTDWKTLLMANRRLETLYLQLSLTPTAADPQVATRALASAKVMLSRADTRFRDDLLLPASAELITP
jgi:hypothetical protein